MHSVYYKYQAKIFGWLFCLWLISVTIIVLIPRFSITRISIYSFEFRADYILHTITHMVGSVLFFLWISAKQKSVSRSGFVLYLVFGFTYAGGSEYIQELVPGRVFNIYDLLSNCLGVAIGSIGFMLATNYLKGFRQGRIT